jgi:V/A-type H+-transporting ATPase subunit I
MGFLRPVKMVKIGFLGLKDDRERIVATLHDLGVVQLEPIRKDVLELLEAEHADESQRATATALLRIRGLRSALPPVPVTAAPASWPNRGALLTEAAAVPIDPEVAALKREEDHLLTERKGVRDTLELLDRHAYYTDRLEYLQGRHLLAFFGEGVEASVARFRAATAKVPNLTVVPGPVAPTSRFLVAVPTADAEFVARAAQTSGVRLVATPNLPGTIAESRPGLIARQSAIDARLTQIYGRLGEISQYWYARITALEEGLTIENRKFEAWGRMGSGASTFALEGWVPVRSRARVEAAVQNAAQGRVEIYPIPTTEEPPTLLDNPPGVRTYEFFIRFFGLPVGTEWDPTFIFAIAFPVFFGFMLGDWGYGSAILAICLWMIAGFPGGRHLPKGIRSMVTGIMGPSGMQMLARTLVPGCIVAIGVGLTYDRFFGALFPFATPFFDPVTNLGELLVLSGYIGLAMVTLGFALGIVRSYYTHHRGLMIARIGGIGVSWGLAFVGLAVIRGTFAFGALGTQVPLALLLGGIVLLVVGEGLFGFMGILEVMSHIISYTRLVGILLSSAFLAIVINTIAQQTASSDILGIQVIGIVIGLVILIGGQTFNLIVGVFEPGIQGARLLFVEHFSKYYEGGGKSFQPFASGRRYTRPWIDAIPPSGVPA